MGVEAFGAGGTPALQSTGAAPTLGMTDGRLAMNGAPLSRPRPVGVEAFGAGGTPALQSTDSAISVGVEQPSEIAESKGLPRIGATLLGGRLSQPGGDPSTRP